MIRAPDRIAGSDPNGPSKKKGTDSPRKKRWTKLYTHIPMTATKRPILIPRKRVSRRRRVKSRCCSGPGIICLSPDFLRCCSCSLLFSILKRKECVKWPEEQTRGYFAMDSAFFLSED